jgi:hypothetical protein
LADSDLVWFHAQSLQDYAVLWFDPAVRQEKKVSREEAAYHLFEHTAMLFRYTGRGLYLQGLTDQSPERRRSLVLAVCRYLKNCCLTATAGQLLSGDILDAEQLTELEDLMIERDGIEEVLRLAERLSADLLRAGDSQLRQELATVRSIVAELDDVLWERPDALTVACRALAGLRAQLAAEPDTRGHWWFGIAADLDETFDQAPLWKLVLHTDGPLQSDRPKRPIPLSASLFRGPEVKPVLAAADAWQVAPVASLGALIPEVPGVRVIVTRLQQDTYQFVFIDNETCERATRLDGHSVVVRCGNDDRAKFLITGGLATVQVCKGFDTCWIEADDCQIVGTFVLDDSDR